MRVVTKPKKFRLDIIKHIDSIIDKPLFSRNLEIGIFNASIQEATTLKVIKKWSNPYFVELYLLRLRSIINNINSYIISEIISDNIKPQTLAFMTHQELNPEKWKLHIEKKMKRDKIKYETKIAAATDTFTCGKCKSNECTYYQMQTRSADEPMTTFVTCINCGNRWKC
jgi:transcription elongation factor S-II